MVADHWLFWFPNLGPSIPTTPTRTPKDMLAVASLVLATLVAPQAPQTSEIKHIDYYGLRTVSIEAASEALGIQVGDSVEIDRTAASERLRAIEAIEDVVLIKMFMPGSETLLVGILEKGTPTPTFRKAPVGDETLPEGMVEAYTAAMELSYEAMLSGQGSGEEIVNGSSISKYESAAIQDRKLADLARAHPARVRQVLRNAKDPEQRAVAATATGHLEDKPGVIEDLAFAMDDPDASVRNNAIRALSVLARWANSQDDLRVEFDYAPLFLLLESLQWTDRNKAASLLDSLTFGRDEKLLSQLRKGSIPALTEMAKWHSAGHAAFSIRILGRMAGITEEEITKGEKRAWSGGYEEHVRWVDSLAIAAAKVKEDGPKPSR